MVSRGLVIFMAGEILHRRGRNRRMFLPVKIGKKRSSSMYNLRAWRRPLYNKLERTRVTIVALLFLILATFLGGIAVLSYFRATGPTSTNPAWQCQHAVETANPVKAENLCPGTDSWRQDRPTGP